MSIDNQLLLNDETKILGFVGGMGRDYLADALSTALIRVNKKVVLSHIKKKMVPRLGSLLHHTTNRIH